MIQAPLLSLESGEAGFLMRRSDSGLERKYDIRGYVRKADSLQAGQDLNPRTQP